MFLIWNATVHIKGSTEPLLTRRRCSLFSLNSATMEQSLAGTICKKKLRWRRLLLRFLSEIVNQGSFALRWLESNSLSHTHHKAYDLPRRRLVYGMGN